MLFEVGKKFPSANPTPGQDNIRAVLDRDYFSLQVFLSDISENEIKSWSRGKLRYGLFIKDAIPFIIIDFPEAGWNVDFSLSLFNVKSVEERTAWLESSANLFSMSLIETSIEILAAARQITFASGFNKVLKTTLREQILKYNSPEEVNKQIDHIQATMTTEKMMPLAIFRTL